MKNIVLLCNMGLSTSALMKKMKNHAEKIGFECEISAHPVTEAVKVGEKADCLLLGPQISYQMDRVKKILPDKPIEGIDMRSYGMLDGEAVLNQAKKLMGV